LRYMCMIDLMNYIIIVEIQSMMIIQIPLLDLDETIR